VRKRDSKNAYLVVVLGDAGRTFSWSVDLNVLTSNGNPTTYALTYDGAKVAFHVGRTVLVANVGDSQPAIKLGNSEMVLNPMGNVDFKLVAFAYYKAALTGEQLAKLHAYYGKQLSGINVLVDTMQAAQQALVAQLQAAQDLLNQTAGDLSQCEASAQDEEPSKHWQIKFDVDGAASVTDDDLSQCTPLKVRFGKKKVETAAPPLSGKVPKIPLPPNV
jgi:predicted DNA-binding protein YlxM (UPF0122 family)